MARALDHIDAHLAEPLTAADLAQAAGLSQRGLQQAFSRNDLPTPLEALREARLRRARAALADARPGEVSIAAIARACGFSHLGRFAGYYAERFGELPSDTSAPDARPDYRRGACSAGSRRNNHDTSGSRSHRIPRRTKGCARNRLTPHASSTMRSTYGHAECSPASTPDSRIG